MGGGFFSNGQFNLVISLRYTPDDDELAFLCSLFEQTSRILHDLTDGTHSFGQILFSINSMGGADADIWIHPNNDVWPNSTAARLWFPREALDMSQDFMYYPTILAHELCHYLYDLRDEYNNGTHCQDDITTQASMMEGYPWGEYTQWTDAAGNAYPDWATFWADFTAGNAVLQQGQPSEFCHDGNHDSTANNNQNNLNGNQSCWAYIVNDTNHSDIPYGLVAPGAGGPTLAPPNPLPSAVVCTELIPVQRFMLILDRSGSMIGTKFEQLQLGANFWVDYVNTNEELGIVSYANAPTLDTGISEVPSDVATATQWRDDRHDIVDFLNAWGSTAIGDALRIGMNDIVGEGRASSQVMILFTDGLQNSGTETAEQVLPDLVAAGVRVYTIGLGTDQNAALLANIAETTGASYISISGDLDPTDAATAISDALILVAGESRENGGVVSFNDVDPASQDRAYFGLPYNWKLDQSKAERIKKVVRSFKFPVRISPGSSHCTLGVKWEPRDRQFRIKVIDPNGLTVSPGPNVRYVEGAYQYRFYEIDDPEPGTWQVVVYGRKLRDTRFRTIGFEVNERMRLELNAIKTHIIQGETILLRARILTPYATPGVHLEGLMFSPSLNWSKIRFEEHTGEKGDSEERYTYTASIETSKIEQGQYLFFIDASRKQGSFELRLDELYRQKPGLREEDMVRKVYIPPLNRRSYVTVVASPEGPSKRELIPGFSKINPWMPKDQKEHVDRWKKNHQTQKRKS